ncbi:Xyloglucanase [Pontiella desulfatans]|uniref:Xyloglucanase n=1 Tax=Pontiella desulfatans TaxID=2750659 RepID=A0A6C2TW44_PONDE|nr:Xyloglucanase [Pontiella desulfatans]
MVSLAGWVLSSSAAVVWSEDFEGAALNAASGNNQTLPGTVLQTANSASGIIVDATTDSAAAAAFPLASGKFIRLSTDANAFTALRSSLNPIPFGQVPPTATYALTFDMYLPDNLAVAVGDFQPRFALDGAGGNGPTDASSEQHAAGQYHVAYAGPISDFIATDVNEVRPFIGIDQAGALLADYLYIDNIHLEITEEAEPPPPLNTAYFANLKANRVESTPLVKWKQFGPGMSGYIDKFWINNGDPDAMYTQLDMGNGHVTLNRGEYWTSYKEIDGNGLPGGITGIEFSYQDPDFGLMMAKEGIYSTTNRGRSWFFLLDIEPANSQMHSVLAVDPNNDAVWYIGAGQHWMIKDTHFTQSGLFYSTDGNYSSGFILKSTDKGQSWTKVTSVFPADSDFSKIIVDPRNSDVVYASNQHGVYKSTNGGADWALVPGHGQLPHNQPRDMGFYFDGADEFLLYVLEVTHYTPNGSTIDTSGGVFRSADGGANWEDLAGNLGIDMGIVGPSSYGYREKYFWAVGKWLETTTDDVKTNHPVFPTNTFSQFTRIAVDPTNKDRVYLSHNYKHDYAFPPGNIWMTENGGTNWIAAAREGPYWMNGTDQAYWQSRGQPLGMNANFAHVDREHRENDNTQSGPRFVFCNPLGDVYTAFAQQVMCSTDHGATWNQVDDDETFPGSGHWVGRGDCNLPGETFCLQTGTPGTYLWGSGEHGLWRNTDDGNLVYPGAIAVEQLTGQSISDNSPLSISTIATDPRNPNHVYMIPFRQDMRGELLFSDDGGDSWTTLSTPIVFPGANDVLDSRSLLIDHQDANNLYFCIPFSEWERWSGNFVNNGRKFDGDTETFGQGIYKSTNGGISFDMATNGIPANRSVYRLAMDQADPQILYAALNETHNGDPGGLYQTTDGGGQWNPLPIPSGIRSVNHVVVHANGGIYIACGDYNGSTGGGYVSQDGGASWHLLFDMPYLRHFVPSMADPDIIAVTVERNTTVGQRNPGLYVTIDGGANWHKINNRHGQPDGIRKVEPDPYDPDVLWMGNHGTGFFRADISPLKTGEPIPFFWDWMEENGQKGRLADADADGFDGPAEFVAGTDPDDGGSYLRADLAEGNRIAFESVEGRLYTIEVAGDLRSGWSVLTNGVAGTGGPLEFVDAGMASNRFYRVQVELP